MNKYLLAITICLGLSGCGFVSESELASASAVCSDKDGIKSLNGDTFSTRVVCKNGEKFAVYPKRLDQ